MEFLIFLGVVWALYSWLKPSPIRGKERVRGISDHKAASYSSRDKSHLRKYGVEITSKDESISRMINDAIEAGEDLSFEYIDQEGELTNRTVSPSYLERRHEDQILCMVAHCHLRNATRTFVIRRMKNVLVI